MQSIELQNNVSDMARELRESWDNRLDFPPTEIPKRYLRGDLGVLLQCSTNDRSVSGGHFSLLIEHNFSGKFGHVTRDVEYDPCSRCDNREFAVFVEPVHIVDDSDGMTSSIVPSCVRLRVGDQLSDHSIPHSLYFSFVSGDCLFVRWPRLKHGKFDYIGKLAPSIVTRKVPNDVVKGRSQMVNNFSRENAESQWNDSVSVIVNRFLPTLVIWIGKNWVLPFFNEGVDLGFQVDDVLVGPF